MQIWVRAVRKSDLAGAVPVVQGLERTRAYTCAVCTTLCQLHPR